MIKIDIIIVRQVKRLVANITEMDDVRGRVAVQLHSDIKQAVNQQLSSTMKSCDCGNIEIQETPNNPY
jgi:hypothetical protein